MSRPVIYHWPLPNATFNEISLSQNVAIGGSFIINGTMSSTNQSATNSPQVIFSGINRCVLIHASAINGANTILVTGLLNGKVVSESIAGPTVANGFSETNQSFDIVTAVSVPANSANSVAGFSVAVGRTGFTNWFLADFNRTFFQFTATGQVLSGAPTYWLECTLDDVDTDSNPYFFDPTGVFPSGAPGPISISAAGSTVSESFLYTRFAINDFAAGTGSLKLSMCQQGIK